MEGESMNEEGWYVDPFGRHEALWISDGTPTALVRDDDGVEFVRLQPGGNDPAAGFALNREHGSVYH